MSFPTKTKMLDKLGFPASGWARWFALIDTLTQREPQSQQPTAFHTGGVGVTSGSAGTNTTPATTTTYIAEVVIAVATTLTGIALLNGAAAAGNIQLALADGTGKVIAMTASTAQAGTTAFQQVPFVAPVDIALPGKYYVMAQFSSASARFQAHALGNFVTTTQAGGAYGTFVNFTPPTTFTTNVGPIADTY